VYWLVLGDVVWVIEMKLLGQNGVAIEFSKSLD
jgi:hypothetical protein